MRFAELARRADYPPGRELVVRELCRAMFAAGAADELCVGARETLRYLRGLVPSLDDDPRALTLALDAGCVADELVRMARVAAAGVGRG